MCYTRVTLSYSKCYVDFVLCQLVLNTFCKYNANIVAGVSDTPGFEYNLVRLSDISLMTAVLLWGYFGPFGGQSKRY